VQPAAPFFWSWNLVTSNTTPAAVIASTAEILLGPFILVAWQLGLAYRRDTIHGEE